MSCKGRREGVAKPGSPVLKASKKDSSNLQPKRRKAENVAKKAVVVAVRASREIPRTALVWALTHVVQPGDRLTLLVVVPAQSSGKKLWGFPRFAGDCASGQRRSLEMNSDITDTCSLMMLQLHDVYDPNNINLNMKIVSGTPAGAVAAESKRARAGWVILDKQLKHEQKRCMEDLQCNIVMMKRSQPKVLRLNLVKSPEAELSNNISSTSPDFGTPFTHTEAAASSISSSDPRTSPCISDNKEPKRGEISETKEVLSSDKSSSGSSPSRNFASQPWVLEILDRSSKNIPERSNVDLRNSLPGPPPICTICQHKTPLLGKPPRWFTYAELALATGGFSESNFLAEGGFGSVHRGILPDGQTVAVKQHKLASSQGDLEFCAEVEVLSCAQHRNVVMLLGFCVEDQRRLLVYEYICNGSLDSHLYGRKKEQLEWAARRKIAVGAARGLRYLHEECRVGCIVHRDVRPNNILLTHDFEPLVGDFGLARWQPDGETGVETRVVGAFGYLAPEYTQSGQITDKADVFSFGVVLLELLSGRKAVDINRPKGQQCLAEWARPLLEEMAMQELLDPRLGNRYPEQEAASMLTAASLCLRRDPHSRPRMSHVLRVLEGGDPGAEPGFYASTPWYDRGSYSARLTTDSPYRSQLSKVNHRRPASCDGLRCT